MFVEMKVENPDNIPVKLTATMTLKEWKVIREALECSGPFVIQDFRDAIFDAICLVEKHFYPQLKAN